MDLLLLLVSDFAVQVYDFGCILLWLALRVTSLLILTAKLCFNLFCSVATASEAVLTFVPICNNGLIGCAIDTGHLFMSHFSDFSSNIRNNISLWETLGVCTWLLLIVCFPKLRKIVSSCLAFMIVAALVLLRKVSGFNSYLYSTHTHTPCINRLSLICFQVLTFRKQSTRRDSPKPFTIQSCLVFFLSTSFAITKWVNIYVFLSWYAYYRQKNFA